MTLRDIIDLPEEDFKMKIFKKCSLGTIEDILNIEEKERFSPNRNDLMHSKSYLMGNSRLPKENRHKRNLEFYQQKALPDLIRCSKKFFEKPISKTIDIFGRGRLKYEI